MSRADQRCRMCREAVGFGMSSFLGNGVVAHRGTAGISSMSIGVIR